MTATRNTLGDTTSDGILDTLDAISQKLDDMAASSAGDAAAIIALLASIDARLSAGIQVQVVTSL